MPRWSPEGRTGGLQPRERKENLRGRRWNLSFARNAWKVARMKAALLPDRGVIKVVGDGARNFLHGLVSADVLELKPGEARFCALLTPQGKIIADFFVTEAPPPQGGGFFLDVARSLAAVVVAKLNLYKL